MSPRFHLILTSCSSPSEPKSSKLCFLAHTPITLSLAMFACHRVVAFQLCFQNAPWPVLVNMDQKHNRKHPNNNLPLLIITSHAQKPSYYIQKYHQHHLNSQHTQSPPWLTLWTPEDHLTIHFTIAKEKSGNF